MSYVYSLRHRIFSKKDYISAETFKRSFYYHYVYFFLVEELSSLFTVLTDKEGKKTPLKIHEATSTYTYARRCMSLNGSLLRQNPLTIRSNK